MAMLTNLHIVYVYFLGTKTGLESYDKVCRSHGLKYLPAGSIQKALGNRCCSRKNLVTLVRLGLRSGSSITFGTLHKSFNLNLSFSCVKWE